VRRWNLSHYAMSSSVTAALLAGCGGSQPPIGAPRAMPQTPVAAQAARPAKGSGPFLYVGGFKLLMYALGSSKPLHVAKTNPSTILRAAIALDLHGHLCESNGEITYPEQLFEYDADTLKFVRGLGGVSVHATRGRSPGLPLRIHTRRRH
jgi:hypothetical protein